MPAIPRRASPADPVVQSPRRLELGRLVRVLLFAAAGFAVLYLVAANLLLRTRLLRDLVSRGDDVELEYASAYSVWPGLVHVRGLALEVQDYRNQLSVAADAAVLDVCLHDLLLRRFHVSDAALSGLAFRYRQKVEARDGTQPYVAAFPQIRGFPDPPVLAGEEPPPVPDAEYDLWQIAIDEVDAELRELWILEYRYRGLGTLRGGFRLQPGRHFAVYPAAVALKRGTLSVGDAVAAERLELELEAHVEPTDVRQVRGAALAEKMTGRLSASVAELDLGTLDTRGSDARRWRVDGRGQLGVTASMTRGRLDAGSSAELDLAKLVLRAPFGKLAGEASSTLRAGSDGRLEWVTTSPRLSLANSSRYRGPVLGTPRLALMLHSETLGRAPQLRGVELDVPRLVVPSLGWAERWVKGSGVPIRVGGRMEGSAHFSSAAGRGPQAKVRLRLADAELSTERVRAALGGRVDVELDSVEGDRPSSRGHVEIELDGVELERLRERSKPFRAALRLPDLRLALEPEPVLSAGVEAFATPADSLLSLALGSPMLEDLAADVFSLEQLDAQARLELTPRSLRVELARAESGTLKGHGFWQRPAAGDARGAFLISSKVANVGISLVGSDATTAWFVPDDWLSSAEQVAPGPRGPRRRASAPRGR